MIVNDPPRELYKAPVSKMFNNLKQKNNGLIQAKTTSWIWKDSNDVWGLEYISPFGSKTNAEDIHMVARNLLIDWALLSKRQVANL